MNACDVLIGTPAKGVVTIGDAVCYSSSEAANAALIALLTNYVSPTTGSTTPVEYLALYVYDPIFVFTQGDSGFVLMGENASLFCVGVDNGTFTGESGFRGGSSAAEEYIIQLGLNVLHPDADFVVKAEGYISEMAGIPIMVVQG
jgi:hypothetical protein